MDHPGSHIADELLRKILSASENPALLDSCGVDASEGGGSLIAGVEPVEVLELRGEPAEETLHRLEQCLSPDLAAIFTLSYTLGEKFRGIPAAPIDEPDVYIALFDSLLVHDYASGKTRVAGRAASIDELVGGPQSGDNNDLPPAGTSEVTSDLSRDEYISRVKNIKERIRAGDTYQANLTQQLKVKLNARLTPEMIFRRLRRSHPARFSSFIARPDSTVVSVSPERFFRIGHDRTIEASPIKGTRRRGKTADEDAMLLNELRSSGKDRAENTMIVDLMRNDLGRVCGYGTVYVKELCAVERHPTLFHLVSTVEGRLNDQIGISDVLRAVFPSGSITGAPKLSTMQIIRELEPSARGLSMGAIGYYAPPRFGLPSLFDLNVAIRTMVIRDCTATFNVGGGVVIDSDPESEYYESLLKAKALLRAVDAEVPGALDPL